PSEAAGGYGGGAPPPPPPLSRTTARPPAPGRGLVFILANNSSLGVSSNFQKAILCRPSPGGRAHSNCTPAVLLGAPGRAGSLAHLRPRAAQSGVQPFGRAAAGAAAAAALLAEVAAALVDGLADGDADQDAPKVVAVLHLRDTLARDRLAERVERRQRDVLLVGRLPRQGPQSALRPLDQPREVALPEP